MFSDEDNILYAPYYNSVPANLEELKNRFLLNNISKQFCCYPFAEWKLYVIQAFAALSDKYVPLFEKVNAKIDLLDYGNEHTEVKYDGTLDRSGENIDTFDKDYQNGKTHSETTQDTSFDNTEGGTIRQNRNIFYQTPQDDLASSIAYNSQGNPVIQNGGNLSRNYATNMTKDLNEEIHNEKQKVISDITTDAITNEENGTVRHGIDNTDTHHFTTITDIKGGKGDAYYRRLQEYLNEFNGIYNSFLNEPMIQDLFSIFIQ